MCSIDWATLRDIVGSLSAVFVAIIAFMGFNRWRDELMGKSKYATARKIFSIAFRFRDQYLRSVFAPVVPEEWEDRAPSENEPAERTRSRNEEHARQKRAETLKQICHQLEGACQDAEILMHENAYELAEPFWQIWSDFVVALNAYYAAANFGVSDPDLAQHAAVLSGVKQSSRSNNVDPAIDHLKQRLQKYVSPEPLYQRARSFAARLRAKVQPKGGGETAI